MKSIFGISALSLVLLLSVSANAEWVKQKSASFAWLRDVYFQNATDGWIVGTDGTMLTTIDGGVTWKAVPKFTTDSLVQILFTNSQTGWLLCERNVFNRGQNAASYLRKTVDGGRTWEMIEFEEAGRDRVTKILFNNLGWGIAFGEGGKFYRLQEDGRTWKKSTAAIHFLLLDGAFTDGLIGAIAGAGGTILFTENNGLTWENATLTGNITARVNAIFFAERYRGWAVGTKGSIFTSNGGGRLWRPQESGTDADLTDVYFLNAREGWAVGDQGTILRTLNGGQTWSIVNSRVKHKLERVFFNGSRGWAVGFGGTILAYGVGSDDDKPSIQRGN